MTLLELATLIFAEIRVESTRENVWKATLTRCRTNLGGDVYRESCCEGLSPEDAKARLAADLAGRNVKVNGNDKFTIFVPISLVA